ncbi:MAG: maleylpyruvate isomerase family mycothiol-dependent enzyme [Actinobacteria bacterium]|nr:maleylpyruvate isomerase family mycothiol-dependent enzyme [Actinomycetota bacterium]
MEIAEHVAALRRDGTRLADVAARVGLDAATPTCPGWRIADLVGHLGGAHRWAAAYLTTASPTRFSDERVAELRAVPDRAGLLEWFRAGHAELVAALAGAPPDVACWTFMPAPSPLAFWARRMAHETAIHRVDAESAVPTITGFPPEFAADGVTELLAGFFARSARLRADPPVSLSVRATDVDAGWTLRIGAERCEVVAADAAADVSVAGSASDLYLFLWNRIPADGLAVDGDASVLELWRGRATI